MIGWVIEVVEVDVPDDPGLVLLHELAARGHDARRDGGRVAGAAVEERRVGRGQADRRDGRGTLPEGHLDVVADVPGGVREALG